MRLTKTLLAAAAFVGASTATSKAYDLYNSGWDYTLPSNSQSFTQFGGNLWNLYYGVQMDSRLVDAGVYRGVSGQFSWSNNVYWDGDEWRWDFVDGEVGTSDTNDVTNLRLFDYGYDVQYNNTLAAGTFYFDSSDNFDASAGIVSDQSTNIAIGQRYAGIWTRADGDEDQSIYRAVSVFERPVQVARTGSGAFGAYALTAFASDNSETLSGSFYGETIVGRNVLPVAAAFYDGEGGYGPSLNGSVIRSADIALGFSGSEGLFAKDGGWLDIRGDLTLGANGTIYIRDGEITSNIYTQFYTPGTLSTVGVITIESGILSVREHFAQDMAATWGQTLGFRDGAINETRLFLEGAGYGFDGEGGAFGPEGSSFGALRSITGDNVQNGNISVIADGEGFFGPENGAVIGTDAGSKLTVNGTVNGLNSGLSEGGAVVVYFSQGDTIQNGRILSGITDVIKAGSGELLLTASNLFTGDVQIQEGSLRITNSGALSGTSGHTFVSSGASLVLDNGAGLTLADDIHIDGTGTKDIGGAIHNKSGSNSTSGNLWIDSVGGGDASATVRVDGGTSLSVNNLRTNGSYDTLTVDVGGSGATAGNFVVNGETGAIDVIIKNGTGNASIAALEGAVDEIHVNGGNLLVLGSEDSAADNVYDNLDVFGTADGEGKPLGSLEFRGTHHYGDFNVTDVDMIIKGAVTQHYDYDGSDMDLNGVATVTVDAGAFLITRGDSDSADLEDASTLVIKGTFNAFDGSIIDLDDEATLEVMSGGRVNSDVVANDYAEVILRTGGTIVGNVDVYDNATFTIETGSTHTGDYNAYGSSTVVVNGTLGEGSEFSQNFRLSGNSLLKGSGTITGDLSQTGGRVAPGNSTDVLTVLGNYSINAGSLQIEIGGTDGPGNDPTGNDQLRVGGTATVGGTAVLDFQPYNSFESSRRGVYQILATDTGAARATIGTFDTVEMTGLNDRVLFDHSTGRAYGTGLSLADTETFRDYGSDANRREIGRALWMESVARDNSAFSDENYADWGLTGPAFVVNPEGLKAFIQTRDASLLDETQVQTDLGAAAVSILTAPDVGAALDALSPEAYVGISELGVRVTRNFAQLPGTKRKLGPANEWDFSVGYSSEQITAASGQTSFTNYKVSSDQIHLTAAKDLTKNLRLTLAAGLDDGKVGAAGFTADTESQAFALGLGFTPDSKGWTADLGVALTRTDWDANRGAGRTGADNEDGLGVALRVSLAPTVDGALSYAPYIGLAYATQDQSGVSESGADNDGVVGIGFEGYERKSLVSELGLKAEYALKPGTTLTGVVAWEHEFEDDGETTLDAEFTETGVDDTRFAVTSAGFGADILRVGVGVRVELGAKSALSLGYDALLSSDAKSGQGIKADVSFRF